MQITIGDFILTAVSSFQLTFKVQEANLEKQKLECMFKFNQYIYLLNVQAVRQNLGTSLETRVLGH